MLLTLLWSKARARVGAVVEHSPSTNVAQVRFPDSASIISGLSLLVLCSAPRGFSPGTPVFPSPQKPTFDLICAELR